MKTIKLAIIGAGGYGDYCLGLLERFVDPKSYRLVAAIDPFYERVPRYQQLIAQEVAMYRTPEEFFCSASADLVLIASPIHLHKNQCLLALQNGAHVLCEKPLAPILQDALDIRDAVQASGCKLGVGFQMSFCNPIQSLKRDIQSGLLGMPKSLRTYVSWQRYDSYYNSPWRGHIYDAQGNWVLDSILTNATAHYLHNTCFVLGDRFDSAAMPQSLMVELYNGKGIETFDTAFVSGKFASGCEFFLALTHSGDRNIDPILQYTFENAVVTATGNDDSAQIIATFSDGTTKNYGAALGEYHVAQKLRTMIAVAGNPNIEVPCTPETVLPHLTMCNAIFDQAEIYPLPDDRLERVNTPESGIFMRGLTDDAWTCFQAGKLPSQLGLSWAKKPNIIQLNGYNAFSGKKFLKREEIKK